MLRANVAAVLAFRDKGASSRRGAKWRGVKTTCACAKGSDGAFGSQSLEFGVHQSRADIRITTTESHDEACRDCNGCIIRTDLGWIGECPGRPVEGQRLSELSCDRYQEGRSCVQGRCREVQGQGGRRSDHYGEARERQGSSSRQGQP